MKRNKRHQAIMIFFTLCVFVSCNARAVESPTDKQITLWIKQAFLDDPRIDASAVNVNTQSGVVTLTGLVRNLAAKDYADLETKKIAGVRAVLNQILVSPIPRSDADITQSILRRFLNSAEINLQGIFVKVDEGNVTLNGEVNSWSQRQEAVLLAKEVRGVRAVREDLRVINNKKRSDDEICSDVIAAIDRDVYLSGLPIHVSVKKGTVTLKGEVSNAYQKDRAWYDAFAVDNVKNIDDHIDVVWRESGGVRKQEEIPSDAQIEKSVRDTLIHDVRVNDPFEITIETEDGNVTLRGSVRSYYQKRLAERDIRDVVGVGWVSNLLTVKGVWREDSGILDDIQFEMDVDPILNSQNIDIRVKDGIVTLFGDVNTYYERSHAAEVASHVLGVRDIVNTLIVNWAPSYSDSALRDRIKRRLVSNAETNLVANSISVKVENGQAILSGDVNTWAEYKNAARIALLTEGIRGLDNRLSVAGTRYHWEEWR